MPNLGNTEEDALRGALQYIIGYLCHERMKRVSEHDRDHLVQIATEALETAEHRAKGRMELALRRSES